MGFIDKLEHRIEKLFETSEEKKKRKAAKKAKESHRDGDHGQGVGGPPAAGSRRPPTPPSSAAITPRTLGAAAVKPGVASGSSSPALPRSPAPVTAGAPRTPTAAGTAPGEQVTRGRRATVDPVPRTAEVIPGAPAPRVPATTEAAARDDRPLAGSGFSGSAGPGVGPVSLTRSSGSLGSSRQASGRSTRGVHRSSSNVVGEISAEILSLADSVWHANTGSHSHRVINTPSEFHVLRPTLDDGLDRPASRASSGRASAAPRASSAEVPAAAGEASLGSIGGGHAAAAGHANRSGSPDAVQDPAATLAGRPIQGSASTGRSASGVRRASSTSTHGGERVPEPAFATGWAVDAGLGAPPGRAASDEPPTSVRATVAAGDAALAAHLSLRPAPGGGDGRPAGAPAAAGAEAGARGAPAQAGGTPGASEVPYALGGALMGDSSVGPVAEPTLAPPTPTGPSPLSPSVGGVASSGGSPAYGASARLTSLDGGQEDDGATSPSERATAGPSHRALLGGLSAGPLAAALAASGGTSATGPTSSARGLETSFPGPLASALGVSERDDAGDLGGDLGAVEGANADAPAFGVGATVEGPTSPLGNAELAGASGPAAAELADAAGPGTAVEVLGGALFDDENARAPLPGSARSRRFGDGEDGDEGGESPYRAGALAASAEGGPNRPPSEEPLSSSAGGEPSASVPSAAAPGLRGSTPPAAAPGEPDYGRVAERSAVGAALVTAALGGVGVGALGTDRDLRTPSPDALGLGSGGRSFPLADPLRGGPAATRGASAEAGTLASGSAAPAAPPVLSETLSTEPSEVGAASVTSTKGNGTVAVSTQDASSAASDLGESVGGKADEPAAPVLGGSGGGDALGVAGRVIPSPGIDEGALRSDPAGTLLGGEAEEQPIAQDNAGKDQLVDLGDDEEGRPIDEDDVEEGDREGDQPVDEDDDEEDQLVGQDDDPISASDLDRALPPMARGELMAVAGSASPADAIWSRDEGPLPEGPEVGHEGGSETYSFGTDVGAGLASSAGETGGPVDAPLSAGASHGAPIVSSRPAVAIGGTLASAAGLATMLAGGLAGGSRGGPGQSAEPGPGSGEPAPEKREPEGDGAGAPSGFVGTSSPTPREGGSEADTLTRGVEGGLVGGGGALALGDRGSAREAPEAARDAGLHAGAAADSAAGAEPESEGSPGSPTSGRGGAAAVEDERTLSLGKGAFEEGDETGEGGGPAEGALPVAGARSLPVAEGAKPGQLDQAPDAAVAPHETFGGPGGHPEGAVGPASLDTAWLERSGLATGGAFAVARAAARGQLAPAISPTEAPGTGEPPRVEAIAEVAPSAGGAPRGGEASPATQLLSSPEGLLACGFGDEGAASTDRGGEISAGGSESDTESAADAPFAGAASDSAAPTAPAGASRGAADASAGLGSPGGAGGARAGPGGVAGDLAPVDLPSVTSVLGGGPTTVAAPLGGLPYDSTEPVDAEPRIGGDWEAAPAVAPGLPTSRLPEVASGALADDESTSVEEAVDEDARGPSAEEGAGLAADGGAESGTSFRPHSPLLEAEPDAEHAFVIIENGEEDDEALDAGEPEGRVDGASEELAGARAVGAPALASDRRAADARGATAGPGAEPAGEETASGVEGPLPGVALGGLGLATLVAPLGRGGHTATRGADPDPEVRGSSAPPSHASVAAAAVEPGAGTEPSDVAAAVPLGSLGDGREDVPGRDLESAAAAETPGAGAAPVRSLGGLPTEDSALDVGSEQTLGRSAVARSDEGTAAWEGGSIASSPLAAPGLPGIGPSAGSLAAAGVAARGAAGTAGSAELSAQTTGATRPESDFPPSSPTLETGTVFGPGAGAASAAEGASLAPHAGRGSAAAAAAAAVPVALGGAAAALGGAGHRWLGPRSPVGSASSEATVSGGVTGVDARSVGLPPDLVDTVVTAGGGSDARSLASQPYGDVGGAVAADRLSDAAPGSCPGNDEPADPASGAVSSLGGELGWAEPAEGSASVPAKSGSSEASPSYDRGEGAVSILTGAGEETASALAGRGDESASVAGAGGADVGFDASPAAPTPPPTDEAANGSYQATGARAARASAPGTPEDTQVTVADMARVSRYIFRNFLPLVVTLTFAGAASFWQIARSLLTRVWRG